MGLTLGRVTPDKTIKIKFLAHQPTMIKCQSFIWPDSDDIDEVDSEDVVGILPKPQAAGGIKRASKRLTFNGIDLTPFF